MTGSAHARAKPCETKRSTRERSASSECPGPERARMDIETVSMVITIATPNHANSFRCSRAPM